MVTAVCSRYENFPNVVLEAMARGCPLVAPEVGGVPEIVQDGRNGLLFRPGDAADLAQKLLALLGNPSLAEKLGRQGAVDCSERYDPDKLAEKTIAFYRQVIERWNHRRRSIW
jgi:glycosyltransferase involved in cell wall biosynthesis